MELVPIGMYQLGVTRGIGLASIFILFSAIVGSIILFSMIYSLFKAIEEGDKFNTIIDIFILIFLIPFNAAMYAWAFYSKPVYTQQYSVQITKDTDIYELSQEYEITGISNGAIIVIARENTNETIP